VLQYVSAYTLAILAVMIAMSVKHPWFKLSGYLALAVTMAVLQLLTIPWGAIDETLTNRSSG
jgi:hypothetical protein